MHIRTALAITAGLVAGTIYYGLDMRLISNWRKAHKMISVQAMALAGAIQATWPLIPDDLKAAIPPHIVHWVSLALLVAGIAGRLVQQDSVK